jgi:hypothetical protein
MALGFPTFTLEFHSFPLELLYWRKDLMDFFALPTTLGSPSATESSVFPLLAVSLAM